MVALHNTEAEGYHPQDVDSAEVEGEEEKRCQEPISSADRPNRFLTPFLLSER
jgi:hypothetical protein